MHSSRLNRLAIVFLSVGISFAQSSGSQKQRLSQQVSVPGSQRWTDTGIEIKAGERLVCSGEGEMRYASQLATPEGMQRGWADLVRSLPVNAVGRGALVGRIGGEGAQPFAIGSKKELVARSSGHLFLGLNQNENEVGDGSYRVTVQVFEADTATANAIVAKPVAITPEILQQIPRRIGDQEGNPGDMVNFFVIGSKDALAKTFDDAGWKLADRTKKEAVLNALVSSLGKNAYLAMPMSELYLFGRAQDFGYEHAEPVQMVAQRHHLRIWRAPVDVDGQPLWVGAATHDIGFERDQRNNGVTHKIDPEIDKERQFVSDTLNETGNVAALNYATPSDAVKEAHTATGGSWTSDGRILIIQLR